jgi:hypothetical protein
MEHAMRPQVKVAIALVVLVVLACVPGCAAFTRELRSGWVKVEFTDGKYHDEVVCRLSKNSDGDVDGKCIPLDDYLTAILEKLDGLGMLQRPSKADEL